MIFDLEKLKEMMDEHGDTLKKASQRCGISHVSLHFYLKGKTSPKLQSLQKLSEGYGKDITFFLKRVN